MHTRRRNATTDGIEVFYVEDSDGTMKRRTSNFDLRVALELRKRGVDIRIFALM